MNQAGRPLQLDAVHLRDALVQAEARHRADVLVLVVLRLLPAHDRARCCRPAGPPGAPRAGRWASTARRAVRGQVGHAAQSPALHAPSTTAPSSSTTCSLALQSTRPRSSRGRSVFASIGLGFTPAVQTIVSAGELVAVAELHDTADARLQPGVEPDVHVAAQQHLHRVGAHVGVDLGQDPLRRLDQHPVHVAVLQFRVVLAARRAPCPPSRPAPRCRRSRRRRTRTSAPACASPGRSVVAATSSRSITWLRR